MVLYNLSATHPASFTAKTLNVYVSLTIFVTYAVDRCGSAEMYTVLSVGVLGMAYTAKPKMAAASGLCVYVHDKFAEVLVTMFIDTTVIDSGLVPVSTRRNATGALKLYSFPAAKVN
jgi:hypothetical protein